ncbi:MAG: helix-turn-helix domain-containing protein [Aeromicrobium sp.]|uniref:PucR family transcriptional regulator n=1 Tax=Aeromicrobium sp. TaxID=1871063 RepID=UPI0039E31CB5
MTVRPPDSRVAEVARHLLERLDELTDQLVDRLAEQIDVYRDGGLLAADDVRRSTRDNLEDMLRWLADDHHGLAAPRRTGQARAEQGAPLPEVLRSFRIGTAFLWEQLLAQARTMGRPTPAELLDAATDLWGMADDYSIALTESYRAAVGKAMVDADRRRSALVSALLDGPSAENKTAWEIARMLGLPFEGSFLVVVAETPEWGESALPGVEERLRPMDVMSAWRAQVDREVGVLSYGRHRSAEEVRDVVSQVARGRVGVSPVFTCLDQTPRALRFAQVAVESLPPGSGQVRQLRDSPLAELVIDSRDTTSRFVHDVLGEVLALPDEERGTLLTTAEAWLDARGSAADAARVLYCHENTVRQRLRRLEERLRGELGDPMTVAELAIATQALRAFPDLGRGGR